MQYPVMETGYCRPPVLVVCDLLGKKVSNLRCLAAGDIELDLARHFETILHGQECFMILHHQAARAMLEEVYCGPSLGLLEHSCTNVNVSGH